MSATELKKRISELEEKLKTSFRPRVSAEDIEDVSDNYQEALEYDWWRAEVMEEIEDLKERFKEMEE